MAIKIFPQYQSYIHECNKRTKGDIPKIKELRKRKVDLLDCIKEWKEHIDDFGSFSFEELMYYIESDLKNFTFTGYSNDSIVVIIKEISKVNTEIKTLQKTNQPYNTNGLTFPMYREIIKIYNLTLLDNMIFDAYTWHLGFNLGKFRIVAKDNIPRVNSIGEYEFPIDWGTSTKNKKLLESEGASLYGIYNQDGIRWKAFYTQESKFSIRWECRQAKLFIKNATVYRFVPVRGMYEPYRKIYKANNEDTLLINKYEYLRYGNKYNKLKDNS